MRSNNGLVSIDIRGCDNEVNLILVIRKPLIHFRQSETYAEYGVDRRQCRGAQFGGGDVASTTDQGRQEGGNKLGDQECREMR